jgi:hypothetical protein
LPLCERLFPTQSFSGLSPLVLATIFYCLTFETFLFVASYDSQGHGGGIRTHLHTGLATKLQADSEFLKSLHDFLYRLARIHGNSLVTNPCIFKRSLLSNGSSIFDAFGTCLPSNGVFCLHSLMLWANILIRYWNLCHNSTIVAPPWLNRLET